MLLPNGKYAAIYADPPWYWRARSAKGEGRSARRHYSTMTIEQLWLLPVGKIAARDSVLFLWCIDSMLPEALSVVKAWGFNLQDRRFHLDQD